MGIAQHYTSSAHSGDKKAGMQNRATPPTSPTDVAGRPRPGPTNGRAFPGPDARATRQRQRRQHGWLRFVGVAASHPRPSGEAVRLGDCGLPVCCRRQATAAVLYLSPISLLASAHPLPTAPQGGRRGGVLAVGRAAALADGRREVADGEAAVADDVVDPLLRGHASGPDTASGVVPISTSTTHLLNASGQTKHQVRNPIGNL